MIIIHACPSPSGGPGPEISIDVERLLPGSLVTLDIIVSTEGGQSSVSTVVLVVAGNLYTCFIVVSIFFTFYIIFS